MEIPGSLLAHRSGMTVTFCRTASACPISRHAGKALGEEVAAVHAHTDPSRDSPHFTPDSGHAWVRLALALLIGSIGSVGMWSVVVVLPVVQAEFGATRGPVSLAFTLTMLGFGLGGGGSPQ